MENGNDLCAGCGHARFNHFHGAVDGADDGDACDLCPCEGFMTEVPVPRCTRCLHATQELSRLILHVDTDQRDRETVYADLCARCVSALSTFLQTGTAHAQTRTDPH